MIVIDAGGRDSIDACDDDTQDTVDGSGGNDTAKHEQIDVVAGVENPVACITPI